MCSESIHLDFEEHNETSVVPETNTKSRLLGRHAEGGGDNVCLSWPVSSPGIG